MRKIKFRVFDKEFKKMHICGENVHDSMSFLNNQACYYNLQNGCGSLPAELGEGTYELMQYTGLKDKNGKEIYEGDIIVYEIDNGVGIESYCARVFWSENEDKYKNSFEWLIDYLDTKGFDALSRPAVYNEGLEVIGNIYENPELLEVIE